MPSQLQTTMVLLLLCGVLACSCAGDSEVARATFKLEGVERATVHPPGLQQTGLKFVASSLNIPSSDIEAYHLESEGLRILESPHRQTYHPLVAASLESFSNHYPLVLSPDIIWLTISQGLATHIKENHEKLRQKFVSFEEKLELIVERHEFVRGSDANDWLGVFSEFSDKIRQHIGEGLHDLLVPEPFSTTTPTAQAAHEVTLLDAVQNYFDFEVHTRCGIPEFTVEGTPEDWRAIKRRVARFHAVNEDLKPWIGRLERIVDEFIAASEGNHDPGFWRSWFKYNQFSGNDKVTGYIVHLFPYIHEPGKKIVRQDFGTGLIGWMLGTLPSLHLGSALRTPAVSAAPFTWLYLADKLKMVFTAGLFGIAYSEKYGVKPVMGWAVANATGERQVKPHRMSADELKELDAWLMADEEEKVILAREAKQLARFGGLEEDRTAP